VFFVGRNYRISFYDNWRFESMTKIEFWEWYQEYGWGYLLASGTFLIGVEIGMWFL
jgi:hypothetical protein